MPGTAQESDELQASPGRLAAAWGVHALTASGAVVALLALIAVFQEDWRTAGLWMLFAFFIDSIDGTLARRVGVTIFAPRVDGRRLDDIVDFMNYVLVPVVFMYWLGVLPHWAICAAPLLASSYGFSQADAKTDDHFFVGFPSYWNVVALYAWLLDASPAVTTFWVLLFSVGVFVPIRYLYPSRSFVLRRTMLFAAALWLAFVSAIVAFGEGEARLVATWISLSYPVLYMGASFWVGGLQR